MRQQQARRKKSSRWRLFLLLLLLILALVALGYSFYPRYQEALPQQLFTLGIKLESQGKIKEASDCYRHIYHDYPKAPKAAAALYKMGRIWQYDQLDEQQALFYYLQLEYDYPTSKLVLSAREQAAQIVKNTLRDYPRAIELYQRLLESNNGSADFYYNEIADCYFRSKNFVQARIELETLLEYYPQSPLASATLYRKAAILVLEGDNKAARLAWKQLIEQYPDSYYRTLAEIDLAKLFEEEEFLNEALQLYQRLNESQHSPLLQEKIEHLEQRIAAKKEAI